MGRPSNSEQRRQEIVQSLALVMARKGYARATIVEIAKQAGLRPGLIHYHFSSKQAILVELVGQIHNDVQRRYEKLALASPDPKQRLKAFIDARLAKGDGASPNAVAAWVVIGTEAIQQKEVQVLYEKSISSQIEILQQLILSASQQKMTVKEANHLASIIVAAIEGSFQLSVAARNVIPSGYSAESLYKLIDASLKV